MIVVSDTTPLRYLAVLGLLDLLPRLFGKVHCPATVMKECLHPRAPAALREWAAEPPAWLVCHSAQQVPPELAGLLDAGEAEAITLALEWKADVILIDEMDGRRAARERGLITAGTLNILAQAAERGWLDYDGVVGRLRSETNFRTTLAVIEAARAAARLS